MDLIQVRLMEAVRELHRSTAAYGMQIMGEYDELSGEQKAVLMQTLAQFETLSEKIIVWKHQVLD